MIQKLLSFFRKKPEAPAPEPVPVVSYFVAYEYYAGKYHNSPPKSVGHGHTVLNVDGGVRDWPAVQRVSEFIAQDTGNARGIVVSGVRILQIQEINRWNKEMTPSQEASLRKTLAR